MAGATSQVRARGSEDSIYCKLSVTSFGIVSSFESHSVQDDDNDGWLFDPKFVDGGGGRFCCWSRNIGIGAADHYCPEIEKFRPFVDHVHEG
jgi:hypothetical protein